MDKPVRRGRHRIDVENAIIRRREKQFNYEQTWASTTKYFDHWQRNNSKYEAWTSPRYYEENNKLINKTKHKRDRETLLEQRREKLKKLFEEERSTYEIELMLQKNKAFTEKPVRTKLDEIPTDVLKDVNIELKLKEEDRRRHEAELKLYHQWRRNNPIVRQYESKYKCKDLKLSWLDQQIEKRMQKEKEEEENKKILQIHEEQRQQKKREEENFDRYVQEKSQQLQTYLKHQMEELKRKQDDHEELKRIENEELKRKILLGEIEEKQKSEEKRRAARECALYNIQQHKLKLKQKALDIQENLKQETLLLTRLKELELENILADEVKKLEIKEGLTEFLNLVKQQQELETQRQKHLEFLFDSEAKYVYERQNEMWKQEEKARQNLFKNVIATIQRQVEDNLNRNIGRQKQLLEEREEMTKKIEEFDQELQRLKEEEQIRKLQSKKSLDEDVGVKNARKKLQENLKLTEINDELERIRKEEDRLQQEIIKIQQRRAPVKSRNPTWLF